MEMKWVTDLKQELLQFETPVKTPVTKKHWIYRVLMRESMEMKWVTDLKQELLQFETTRVTRVTKKHCIYRVPMRIKDINVKAFEPHIISFGPYHHGKPNLEPAEYDKRRVLYHFLKRTGKPIEEFWAALQEVVEKLMDSYEYLEGNWRDKNRFLSLMLIDGCFLLEIMRGLPDLFLLDDPNFSILGVLNTSHYNYVLLDMLMVENQVPLLALERLWAIANAISKEEAEVAIHEYVQKWNYFPRNNFPQMTSGLHLLDLYGRAMVDHSFTSNLFTNRPHTELKVRSAVELYDAGVIFQSYKLHDAAVKFQSNILLDAVIFERNYSYSAMHITFKNGVLTIPNFIIAEGDETIYLNLIAYEQLRPGAGYGFQTYIIFMSELVNSAQDVVLLKSLGIIESTLDSDEAVADLLKKLAQNVLADIYPIDLSVFNESLNEYYIKNMHKWRKRVRNWGRNLKLNYFNNPWTLISVIVAAAVLILTFVKTYYSIIPYHNPK